MLACVRSEILPLASSGVIPCVIFLELEYKHATSFKLQTRLQGVEQLVYNIQPEIFFYSQKPVNCNAKLQSLCTSNNKKTKNNKKIHEPVLFLYSVNKCPLC